MTRAFDVAIIGAGASGTLTAVQFARVAGPYAHGALIEAGARAARGLAYGTPYGAHLLNVPAARMSALPDDPEHFLRWLRERDPGAQPATFAPRSLYGDYLASLLGDPDVAPRVERVGGTAVGLSHADGLWTVHLHDDRRIAARAVVLALGNLPPSDPLNLDGAAPDEYVSDPWAPGAAVGLAHDAPVLLIGTGLTAVDVAVALRHEGHRGPIFALSRNGRLPLPHAPFTPRPLSTLPADFASPRGVLRWVRAAVANGEEWRALIDSIRPHTPAIWKRWTPQQRGSFYRHAKNLWDVHRHRAAPEVRSELDVDVLRGRIVSMRVHERGIEVQYRPTGTNDARTLVVARVINCTGPASDYARVDLPLVVQLRRAGWLTPDPLRLGVETDADGRLLDHSGNAVDGLFTLGPLRRPALWESTAIPEIREQATALARVLARDLGRAVRAEAEHARDAGRDEAAVRLYEDAIAIYRRSGDTDRLAHTIRHLGDVHQEAGRAFLAEPFLREALALYRESPSTRTLDLANAIRPLAILEENAGHREEARALWQEARELYERAGVDAGVAESTRRLSGL